MNVRSSRTTQADMIDAEAADWFIEFRAGVVSGRDRARFYEWLRRSPENIEAYLEIAEGWAELPTGNLHEQVDIPALIARARAYQERNIVPWSEGQETGGRPQKGAAPRPLSGAWRAWWTAPRWAAAIACLAMMLGLTAWLILSRGETYQTGIGEQRTIQLADGSTIELNARSNIRVRLSEHRREIDLSEGQALFRVAKDRAARPFIVRTDRTSVRAVGTQFDVNRKVSGTVVTVLEGRVAVVVPGATPARPSNDSGPPKGKAQGGAYEPSPASPNASSSAASSRPASGPGSASPGSANSFAQGDGAVFVAAGEQVTVTGQEIRQPAHADITAATAWVEKRLVFEDTALADVAEEFNRYNTRRLVIVDPELRSVGISGVYSSSDPAGLIELLRNNPKMELNETEQEIRVTLRKAK